MFLPQGKRNLNFPPGRNAGNFVWNSLEEKVHVEEVEDAEAASSPERAVLVEEVEEDDFRNRSTTEEGEDSYEDGDHVKDPTDYRI